MHEVKTFRCTVPDQDDSGPVEPFLCQETDSITKEKDALWRLNLTRSNARLPKLKRLPPGTAFVEETHWRSGDAKHER